MDQFSYIFTIVFVLLGPMKIIPVFARVTAGGDVSAQRAVAFRAALLAAAMALSVALLGEGLALRWHLSLPSLQLTGGLVLLLSALRAVFSAAPPPEPAAAGASPLQIAVSLASPTIVTPAGVAALFIFALLSPQYAGLKPAIFLCLGIIMLLDFLVMYFNRAIMRLPALIPVLQILGPVLAVVQVSLAIETMLRAFRVLGLVTGGPA